MLDKTLCLYIYILLYGGAIVGLFVRAIFRERLIKAANERKKEVSELGLMNKIIKLISYIPNQVRALRELGKSITEYPDRIKRTYRHYQLMTRIVLTLILLLIVYSFIAKDLCQH